jgi:hypothetical protein
MSTHEVQPGQEFGVSETAPPVPKRPPKTIEQQTGSAVGKVLTGQGGSTGVRQVQKDWREGNYQELETLEGIERNVHQLFDKGIGYRLNIEGRCQKRSLLARLAGWIFGIGPGKKSVRSAEAFLDRAQKRIETTSDEQGLWTEKKILGFLAVSPWFLQLGRDHPVLKERLQRMEAELNAKWQQARPRAES